MSESQSFLQNILNSAIQNELADVHTSIPCIIVKIRDDLNGMMVDIQPSVNQKFKDDTVRERPVILGVPVQFPVSKSAGFTFPLNVGDTGMAIFSMRNLDSWKSGNGYPSAPMNAAKFDKGDAIFIPGIQPPQIAVNNPATRLWPHDTKDAVVVNNIGQTTEVEVRLKANGDIQINTNNNVEVNCDQATVTANSRLDLASAVININAPTTNWFGDIVLQGTLTQNGNYTSTGTMTFNGINFATHVHGSSPGPSNP